MLTIQELLQRKRQEKALSQVELAKLTGLTQAMVSKVESGKDVRLSTLNTLAKALGLTLAALTQEQAFQFRLSQSNQTTQSLLEQFQVTDDE